MILANVRKAYFNARADYELVDVARETLDDQQTHLQQVQGFVSVGTQPPIALAQQKAAVANAQAQLITAQNNYETAKAQLNQAAGIPGGTDYDVGDEQLQPLDDEEKPLETLVQKALEARPEIASLAKQREAQDERRQRREGRLWPDTLGAVGQRQRSSGIIGHVRQPNLFWSVGRPRSRGRSFKEASRRPRCGRRRRRSRWRDAQLTLEALQVRLDVNSAQLAVRAAKATIGAAEDAVQSAHEQLRLAEQRYATGVGSIIELNDAQVAYTSSAAQVVQARYGLASARAQLLAALGRT